MSSFVMRPQTLHPDIWAEINSQHDHHVLEYEARIAFIRCREANLRQYGGIDGLCQHWREVAGRELTIPCRFTVP